MEKELTCFIVAGRMGKSLILSKAVPFSLNPGIKKIFIFSETEGFPLDKAEYIVLPSWIARIRPGLLRKAVRSVYEPVQLIWHANKIKPDLINGYHLIPKGHNALLAARLTGSKCIISVIGGIIEIETYSRLRFILRRLNLLALRSADLVTTKGSVVNAYIEKNRVNMSGVVVYNGSVDTEIFRPDQSVARDIDVLFVGTFRSLKGPDRVVEIVKMLIDKYPDLRATMIGDGGLFGHTVELARRLGLRDNISFEGTVGDPSGLYRRAKVFVLPSESEGLPTSMLEAMASGCVPVISDVGNISDIAISGVNSFLVGSCTDLASFAGHVADLLSDTPLRESMAAEARRTVTSGFTPAAQSEVVNRMLMILFG